MTGCGCAKQLWLKDFCSALHVFSTQMFVWINRKKESSFSCCSEVSQDDGTDRIRANQNVKSVWRRLLDGQASQWELRIFTDWLHSLFPGYQMHLQKNTTLLGADRDYNSQYGFDSILVDSPAQRPPKSWWHRITLIQVCLVHGCNISYSLVATYVVWWLALAPLCKKFLDSGLGWHVLPVFSLGSLASSHCPNRTLLFQDYISHWCECASSLSSYIDPMTCPHMCPTSAGISSRWPAALYR